MKKIAAKIFILFFLPAVSAGYVEYRLSTVPNSYSAKISQLERQAPGLELLILGSSHAHLGIDPAQFELKSYNMANVSQSLFYDYAVLSKEIGKLTKLKAVIVPVSYFSLEYLLVDSPEAWRSFFYERFYGIAGREKSAAPFDLRRYSRIALYGVEQSRNMLFRGFDVNLAEGIESDGWAPADGGAGGLSMQSGRERVGFHHSIMKSGYSAFNLECLDNIVRLLLGRGVAPVIVTLPALRTYYLNMDPARYDRMRNAVRLECERYGLAYLDYLRDGRFTEADFLNHDHLNRKGAIRFSRILNDDVAAVLGRGAQAAQCAMSNWTRRTGNGIATAGRAE